MRLLDRIAAPFDALYDALTDTDRGDRAVAALLVLFTALYATYAVVANSSTDVHFDVGELVGWSREPSWGYKHPPMSAWFALAWFAVFPLTDWSAYLLAMVVSALSLGIAWRIFREWLGPERRVLALAMLMLVPLYTFHAIKFNANTVMMPFWAATSLFFLRTVRTTSVRSGAMTGLFAAGALLGKYWSINLVAGLGLSALVDRRRGTLLRTAAPYVAVVVLLLALAPHILWLAARGSEAAGFARSIAVANADRSRSLSYVTGSLAYIIVPILLFGALRPNRSALLDTLYPADTNRRLVAFALWIPLLLPAVLNLLVPTRLTSIWTIPNWTLLPVVLLSSPRVLVTRRIAVVALALALVIPLLAIVAAPAIAAATHRRGRVPHSHFRLLGEAAQQAWRETTSTPLRVIGGDDIMAIGTIFYATDRPIARRGLSLDAGLERLIAKDGIVVLCGAADEQCLDYQRQIAARFPTRRSDVELARRFRGVAGKSQRYTVQVVPPS